MSRFFAVTPRSRRLKETGSFRHLRAELKKGKKATRIYNRDSFLLPYRQVSIHANLPKYLKAKTKKDRDELIPLPTSKDEALASTSTKIK